MPNYDDPTILYDSGQPYDGGASVAHTFTTPGDNIVPPIYTSPDPYYPVDPLMQRLFRHYAQRPRGRNIFAMSDGTFLDSQINGQPPNMIQPPTDPYARTMYTQGGLPVEVDTFQVPYVVRTYYGGVANPVNPTEAAALTAAGYTVS